MRRILTLFENKFPDLTVISHARVRPAPSGRASEAGAETTITPVRRVRLSSPSGKNRRIQLMFTPPGRACRRGGVRSLSLERMNMRIGRDRATRRLTAGLSEQTFLRIGVQLL